MIAVYKLVKLLESIDIEKQVSRLIEILSKDEFEIKTRAILKSNPY